MEASAATATAAATAATAAAATAADAARTLWQSSLIGTFIKFAIITAIFIIMFVIVVATSANSQIASEWSRYRCSPYIMPFADFYGYDSTENFQFCVRSIMESQSGQAFAPIYGILGQFTGTLGLVVNSMNGFRSLLGNFKLSTDSFLQSVMGRIRALLFQVRLSFMKMQALMGKLYGTMYSIIWMGTSAITAGMNLADNDLVNFMFEFCFDPATPVRLADGSVVPIRNVQVGTELEGGIRVSSTFRFDGQQTSMVRIGNDILSSKHFILHADRWIPAGSHPAAVPTASLEELVCLNVEGHRFSLASGLVVADYDETEEEWVVDQTMQMAEGALNGRRGGTPATRSRRRHTETYDLGLDHRTEVRLQDGSWRSIQEIGLGTRVLGGAQVVGIVEEECRDQRMLPDGLRVSAAQLVFRDETVGWRRSHDLPSSTEPSTTLIQLITDQCTPLCVRLVEGNGSSGNGNGHHWWVRDYREAPIPDMETAYETHVLLQKNETSTQPVVDQIHKQLSKCFPAVVCA